MDNNRNESYISDESNSKNKIPIRNKIKKNNDRFINNVLTSISNSNSQKKKPEINSDSISNNNDKLVNEYWSSINNINNSSKKKKKNCHKKIKSCNNQSDNNYTYKKTIDIKSNLNNKFYKGENKSVNAINNKKKNIKDKLLSLPSLKFLKLIYSNFSQLKKSKANSPTTFVISKLEISK